MVKRKVFIGYTFEDIIYTFPLYECLGKRSCESKSRANHHRGGKCSSVGKKLRGHISGPDVVYAIEWFISLLLWLTWTTVVSISITFCASTHLHQVIQRICVIITNDLDAIPHSLRSEHGVGVVERNNQCASKRSYPISSNCSLGSIDFSGFRTQPSSRTEAHHKCSHRCA